MINNFSFYKVKLKKIYNKKVKKALFYRIFYNLQFLLKKLKNLIKKCLTIKITSAIIEKRCDIKAKRKD